MSETVYRAIRQDLKEAYKAAFEEAYEKARRETTERMAIGCLKSGVDPYIVAAVTGYSLEELADLLVFS